MLRRLKQFCSRVPLEQHRNCYRFGSLGKDSKSNAHKIIDTSKQSILRRPPRKRDRCPVIVFPKSFASETGPNLHCEYSVNFYWPNEEEKEEEEEEKEEEEEEEVM